MGRMRLLAAAALVAASLTATLTGCQQAAEKAAEEAVKQGTGIDDVDINDDGITVEGTEGTLSIDGGDELPEGWPSQIALPDGGTITGSMLVDQGGSQGWNVVSTYDLSPADLASAFEASLGGAGFTQDSKTTAGDMTLLAYSDATYAVAVTIGEDAGSTTSTVTVTTK